MAAKAMMSRMMRCAGLACKCACVLENGTRTVTECRVKIQTERERAMKVCAEGAGGEAERGRRRVRVSSQDEAGQQELTCKWSDDCKVVAWPGLVDPQAAARAGTDLSAPKTPSFASHVPVWEASVVPP